MLLYKNGKFRYGDLSFILPNNVYVNILPQHDNTDEIELFSEDMKISLTIHGRHTSPDFRKLFGKDEDQWQDTTAHTVLCDNTRGYFRTLIAEGEHVCEFRFRMIDRESLNNTLCIIAKSDCLKIRELIRHPTVTKLIRSIRQNK